MPDVFRRKHHTTLTVEPEGYILRGLNVLYYLGIDSVERIYGKMTGT